jgi:hypothetical protein
MDGMGDVGPDGVRADGGYALHGLRIRSEIPLAGYAIAGDGHDLVVRWGDGAAVPVPEEAPPGRVIADRRSPGRRWYVAVEDGGRYVLRVPGLCDFVVSPALDAVECHPDPATDPRMVSLLTGGLLIAFLLGLAGDCVLHASAVALDDGTIAFAAESGMGKSTLAALLCANGGRLITDDLLRIRFAEDVRCVGGVPQIRLRRGALDLLERLPDSPPAAITVDDRLAVAPPGSHHADTPLAAIVLPRPSRRISRVGTRRVRGAGAVMKLLAVSRLGGWSDPSILRQQFDAATRLAVQVPIIEADIPWGPPFEDKVVTDLIAGVASSNRLS